MSTAAVLRAEHQALKERLDDDEPWLKAQVWNSYCAWFRQACTENNPPDALRQHIANEEARFFSRVLPGADHDYWRGDWRFVRNDGRGENARRWLMAHHLGRPLDLYHETISARCGESRCIRLAHLRLEPRRRADNALSEAEAISMLRGAARELGRSPTGKDRGHVQIPASATVIRIFGSWPEALDAAGLERLPQGGQRRWSDADILAAIRVRASELAHTPTLIAWEREHRKPAAHTITRRFGSWPAALKAAGVTT